MKIILIALLLWAVHSAADELSDKQKLDAKMCADTALMIVHSPIGGVEKAMAVLADCMESHGLAAPEEATAELFRSLKKNMKGLERPADKPAKKPKATTLKEV